MNCPNDTCNNVMTAVKKTIKYDTHVVRMRECPVCLTVFLTQEVFRYRTNPPSEITRVVPVK